MRHYSEKALEDVGEFELLETVVLPALRAAAGPSGLGDDCGLVPLPRHTGTLAVTTDVGPVPLIWLLGHRSYSVYGWYAVTVNISDLAAAGARPLAFSTSVEAPKNMMVSDFRSFFEGIADACQFYDIWSSGGNIRSAPRFECHGTAIGTLKSGRATTRSGLNPDDVILAIGRNGVFMASALAIASDVHSLEELAEDARNSLLQPVARIREAIALAELRAVSAAIDNSDGVHRSLYLLAESSVVDIEIDLDETRLPSFVLAIADSIGCDPWNLALAWGDYQLIVGVPPDLLPRVEHTLRALHSPYMTLGSVHPGDGVVWVRDTERRKRLKRAGNENFTRSSYNDVPIDQYLRLIAEETLYE